MSPCPKRARSRSPTPTNEDENYNADVGPHETLWHEDGNIVLVTDMFLYRVHKSILANQSSVFKDMFQIPTADSEHQNDAAGPLTISEEWNGIPTVKMVDDKDEDVFNLLMALYDRKHYRMYETTTMPILTSLVVMSVKYDFHDIRSEIVKHLMHHFPSKLADFEREKENDLFSEPITNQHFLLLSHARSLNAPILLPLIFYCCAIRPLPAIFELSSLLTKFDYEAIIYGRETMSKFSYEYGMLMLQALPTERCYSTKCHEKRLALLHEHVEETTFGPPLFPLQLSPEGIYAAGGGQYREICRSCVDVYVNVLKSVRQAFWNILPNTFRLVGWEKLEQLSVV